MKQAGFFPRIITALLTLILGVCLSILLIEGLLRLNPRLLLRGMGLSEPVDAPLTVQEYDVRLSEADELFWRPDLIRPVTPAEDRVVSHVRYSTDEYGFRNNPPISAQVDAVVLGRSYSLGAQNPHPWPELAANRLGWKVLNLSIPGADIFVKKQLFEKYAIPHSPRWILVEVEPGIDILGLRSESSWMTERILSPILRLFFNNSPAPPKGVYRYPLSLQIAGRTVDLTCCINYMDTYTISPQTLKSSEDWAVFSSGLKALIDQAKKEQACVAIIYAPLKPEVYLPLAADPEQLQPTVIDARVLGLGEDGRLIRNENQTPTVAQILAGINSGEKVLREFSSAHGVVWIDPTSQFQSAVLAGKDPYMEIDSHWNDTGHAILADLIQKTLSSAPCP